MRINEIHPHPGVNAADYHHNSHSQLVFATPHSLKLPNGPLAPSAVSLALLKLPALISKWMRSATHIIVQSGGRGGET